MKATNMTSSFAKRDQSSAPVRILWIRSRPGRVIAADPSDLNPRLGRVLRLDRTGGCLTRGLSYCPARYGLRLFRSRG